MTFTQASRTAGQAAWRASPVRFCPALNLETGETIASFCEWPVMFEERPAFNLSGSGRERPSATGWMVARLEEIAHACAQGMLVDRPVIVPLPPACCADPGFAGQCLDALSKGNLCPQEISFELTDSELATSAGEALSLVRSLRQYGFRVSLDARQSWCASLSASIWLMIDTVRVKASSVEEDAALRQRVETAAMAGSAIVAEGPFWRDGDQLAAMGIRFGTNPVADA